MDALPNTLLQRCLLACARMQEVSEQLSPLVTAAELPIVDALAANAAALREKLHAAGVVAVVQCQGVIVPGVIVEFHSGDPAIDRYLE